VWGRSVPVAGFTLARESKKNQAKEVLMIHLFSGRRFCLLLVAICALGFGQWLETTIYLPDSSGPAALCYNSTNNKVYSANNWSNSVTIIDGATNSVITTVAAGSGPIALGYNTTNNKIYCANNQSNNVTVIDGATDQIINTVPAGYSPHALCYNPQDNKIYCANVWSNDVTIIDGATNSVITTLPTERDSAWDLCYNSRNDKIYCVNRYLIGSFTVISGRFDSVISHRGAGGQPCALCYNSGDNKIYCANRRGGVNIINGERDSTIASVGGTWGPCALCYDSQDGRIFCADDEYHYQVDVIDGELNSIIATLTVDCDPIALGYNPLNNKVYCASYGNIMVIDAAQIQVIETFGGGCGGPHDICHNPRQNRMYVANQEGSWITVLRDSGGGIEEGVTSERRAREISPSLIRGTFFLSQMTPIPLFDIFGRSVMLLRPGLNNIEALAPGVYFCYKQKLIVQH